MSWRYFAVRYAIVILLDEFHRSRRWSEEDKTLVLASLGALLSVPAVASIVLWVLTGRGPLRWDRPWVAFVNPFPRRAEHPWRAFRDSLR